MKKNLYISLLLLLLLSALLFVPSFFIIGKIIPGIVVLFIHAFLFYLLYRHYKSSKNTLQKFVLEVSMEPVEGVQWTEECVYPPLEKVRNEQFTDNLINLFASMIYTHKNILSDKDFFSLEKHVQSAERYFPIFLELKKRKDFPALYRKTKERYRDNFKRFPAYLTAAINNGTFLQIDLTDICKKMAEKYEDNVKTSLKSYKNKAAMIKRRDYFQKNIDDILNYTCLKGCKEATEILTNLKNELSMHYC
jgi:hypothetical protein